MKILRATSLGSNFTGSYKKEYVKITQRYKNNSKYRLTGALWTYLEINFRGLFLGSYQTSKMEVFAKIVNCLDTPLIFFLALKL